MEAHWLKHCLSFWLFGWEEKNLFQINAVLLNILSHKNAEQLFSSLIIRNVSWATNRHIRIIWHWRLDQWLLKIQLCHHRNHLHLKIYILLVYIPSLFDRCLTAPIWLFCRLCQTGRGLRWICRLICCAQHLVQSCFAGRFLVFSLSGLDLDDLPAVWHITHNALMWPPSDGGWHLKSTFPPLIRHVLSLSRSGKIHHITFPDPPFLSANTRPADRAICCQY